MCRPRLEVAGATIHPSILLISRCLKSYIPAPVLPDCAVCSDGYGQGVSNVCHSCDSTNGQLLIVMGVLFSVVTILLLLLAVVFLVGGLDAVDIVRQTAARPFVMSRMAPKPRRLGRANLQELPFPKRRVSTGCSNDANTSATEVLWEGHRFSGHGDLDDNSRGSTQTGCGPDLAQRAHARPPDAAAGAGIGFGLSNMPGRHAQDVGMPASSHVEHLTVPDARVGGVLVNERLGLEATDGGKARCCGRGENIKHWVSRLPLDKLKILVVIWQILSVFSSITGVEFPESYSTFLSWISVVNLDIGHIFSASCVLPSVNFYTRLLVTTLTPLALAAGLVWTYRMAKRRAGIGSAGVIARRSAWSRHMAAGLLLSFLVRLDLRVVYVSSFESVGQK